ncbi:hypothetical protein ABEB36_011915 [Hypothenemus hampei]|uniref:DUF4774 domain-containing protein n=1 Tax=Hypothenemus hampei TaxID=57062 RepID=A0ABD1EBH5_HYPHA
MWNFVLIIHLVALASCKPLEVESGTQKTVPNVEETTRIVLIPFYGGGKGQSLQIIKNSKGTVLSSVIVKTPVNATTSPEQTEIEINPFELENPPLPSKFDTEQIEDYDDLGGFIRTIQNKAQEIVKLQELAKTNGKLSPKEEITYEAHLKEINNAAKNLAYIQNNNNMSIESREGLTDWFDRKRQNVKNNKKTKENEKKPNKEEENGTEKPEQQQQEEENNDSVAINLPPEDASVAEAKPVGLAVAGPGGVAASKPIATAVVGPGGLAIARPVGTAIAGVSPDQALVPIYGENLGHPKKNGQNKKQGTDQMSEFLNKIINKYHQY